LQETFLSEGTPYNTNACLGSRNLWRQRWARSGVCPFPGSVRKVGLPLHFYEACWWMGSFL
jgi:hypothetical protein